MTNYAEIWLPALGLAAFFIALANRGDEVVAAYWEAPLGIGMPLLMLVLFITVPQMQGMMVATRGGYDNAGNYNEAWWHQIALPVAILMLSLQGWFWTRAGLNAAAGRRDNDAHPVPFGEKWAARLLLFASFLLGVVPVTIVGGDQFWNSSADIPQISVGLSIVFSVLLLFMLIMRRTFVTIRTGHKRLPGSMLARVFVCAPYGPWAAASMLALGIAGMGLAEFGQDIVDRWLHTPSAVLLAASCTVAVGTVWLTALRDFSRKVLKVCRCSPQRATRIARVLGLGMFVLTPAVGSNMAMQLHAYDVGRLNTTDAPTFPQRGLANTSEPSCPAGQTTAPIIVAIAGGASRSAAWSLSVMRMLDIATNDVFGKQVDAISSVSGGSLGAMTYVLSRTKNGTDAERKDAMLRGTIELARFDLLPTVAARLFTIDLLTGIPTRGPALENAIEAFWNRPSGFGMSGGTFTKAVSGPCTSHVLLNGVDAITGAKLLTSSLSRDETLSVMGRDFVHDLRDEGSTDFTSAAAVLNSARFPIISPPGRIQIKDSAEVHVIDGGLYEASGISTAIALADVMTGPDRKPILVIISNDGSSYDKREDSLCNNAPWRIGNDPGRKATSPNGGATTPELLSSVVGLNATRMTRYAADLARAQNMFCTDNPLNRRIFRFDLPTPPVAGKQIEAVPMNWVLTSGNCKYMLSKALRSPANLRNAAILNLLLGGKDQDTTNIDAGVDALRRSLKAQKRKDQLNADTCNPKPG